MTFTQARFFNLFIYCLLAEINCVRWSPSGEMLATTSDDTAVKLLDFKTGKMLYTGNTTDKSPSFPFNIY